MTNKGRPSSFKKRYCKDLIAHMKSGLSYETFAATINKSRETLYEWEKQFPEWAEAKKQAFDHCQLLWEKMGVSGAAGKIKYFNSTAWTFNMRCRFPKQFADSNNQAMHNNANGVTINLAYDPAKPLAAPTPKAIEGNSDEQRHLGPSDGSTQTRATTEGSATENANEKRGE